MERERSCHLNSGLMYEGDECVNGGGGGVHINRVEKQVAEDDIEEESEAEDAIIEPFYKSRANDYDTMHNVIDNM